MDIYVGQTLNELCPVEAILAYVARRGKQSGFFFRFEDGHLLTKDHFISKAWLALAEAGVDSSLYLGHSFRISATTTAGKKGMASEKIKTLGRWESSAYLLYVRLSREELSALIRQGSAQNCLSGGYPGAELYSVMNGGKKG